MEEYLIIVLGTPDWAARDHWMKRKTRNRADISPTKKGLKSDPVAVKMEEKGSLEKKKQDKLRQNGVEARSLT